MNPFNAKICGRFSRVSKDYGKGGPVLVGLCGDVYPHDLTDLNVDHIKTFYNRATWEHIILNEWPDYIDPAYKAAKSNFKNGFILIYKN